MSLPRPSACEYVAWETQPQPLRPVVSPAAPATEPEPEPEPVHTGMQHANAGKAQLSARALPLVLASSAPAVAGAVGWFGLQEPTAAVCRAWRAAALDESCCAELALTRHAAEARWLHGHHSTAASPWRETANQMHRAERGWQNGGACSRQFFSAGTPSLLSLARCRGPGADSTGASSVLASSCFDGRVSMHRVHESRTRQPTVEAFAELWHSPPGGGPAPVDCCAVHAVSREDVLVASGSREQSVKLWRVGAETSESSGLGGIPAAEWAGCGGRVMGVDTDGAMCVAGFQYAAATPPGPRFTSRFAQPEGPDVHGNTPPTAAASVKPLRVWDVSRCGGDAAGGAMKVGLPPRAERHSVACVRWLGNGRVISANIRGYVHAFDLRAPKTLAQTITTNQLGWAVLAMDAGDDAADSVFLSLADQRLVEYDWRRCETPLRSAEVPTRPARSLALDRPRRRLLTGGNEDAVVIRFWDLDRWNAGAADSVGTDPRRLSWEQDGAHDFALCGRPKEGAHSDYVSGVALCGLECWVSASLDGTLRAWQLDRDGK